MNDSDTFFLASQKESAGFPRRINLLNSILKVFRCYNSTVFTVRILQILLVSTLNTRLAIYTPLFLYQLQPK